MSRGRRQAEPEQEQGAPEWMVTFSDCMTLLLTFFVLLLSFSSFDERLFRSLKIIFATAMPSVSSSVSVEKDAFLPTEQIEPTEELDAGSEKPTLARGKEEHLEQETEPADFRNRKVFLVPSEKIFWGKGLGISWQGRRILSDMALLIKEVPNRIVVCESGPEHQMNNGELGLARAWRVLEYLTRKQGLDRNRFSLSAAGTVAQERTGHDERVGPNSSNGPESERTLEVVFLERSIYN